MNNSLPKNTAYPVPPTVGELHPEPAAEATWLVIPVYNEGPVVSEVAEDALGTFKHVVCVDDGSRDESPDSIRRTGAHLIQHPINLGQGAALQTGISYALEQSSCSYIVTFDADGQHRVSDALRMVELLDSGSCDVVLGSRFLTGAAGVPPAKRLVLRSAAALSPTSRRLRLTDAHNGLRAFNRSAAEQLRITINGMAHAAEIVDFLAASGLRVAELPVDIRYTEYSRAKGQSLMNGINILFDLYLRDRGR
jgi:glycosyltransferase involved in cell wall biosynthesis